MSYRSDLTDIPGIGEATATKIMEAFPEKEDLALALEAEELPDEFSAFEEVLKLAFPVEVEEPEEEEEDDEPMPPEIVEKQIEKTEAKIESAKNEHAKASALRRLQRLRDRGLI